MNITKRGFLDKNIDWDKFSSKFPDTAIHIENAMEAYAKQYRQNEMNEFLDAVSYTPENRITLHKKIKQLKELLVAHYCYGQHDCGEFGEIIGLKGFDEWYVENKLLIETELLKNK